MLQQLFIALATKYQSLKEAWQAETLDMKVFKTLVAIGLIEIKN